MTGFTVCLLVLLGGALAPALLLSARGAPVDRFIGLELLSSVLVLVLILFSQVGQSYELIVPLVLVPLSFAGTMVFVRLLGRKDARDAA